MVLEHGETFICPAPLAKKNGPLAGAIINRCRVLRIRAGAPHAFVPIRSMQFQAVIARGEVLFVDHQGGYALEDGIGGRLVALAWRFPESIDRPSLDRMIPVETEYFRADGAILERRILSEFPRALAAAIGRGGRVAAAGAAVVAGPGRRRRMPIP